MTLGVRTLQNIVSVDLDHALATPRRVGEIDEIFIFNIINLLVTIRQAGIVKPGPTVQHTPRS